MARCGKCFKTKSPKDIVPPVDGMMPTVCKGCFYEIDVVLGYLESIQHPYQGRMDAHDLAQDELVKAFAEGQEATTPQTPQNGTENTAKDTSSSGGRKTQQRASKG